MTAELTCGSCPNYTLYRDGTGACMVLFKLKGFPSKYAIKLPANSPACDHHPELSKLLLKEGE